MHSIDILVPSHKSKYSVLVGTDIIGKISKFIDLSGYSSVYIITDSNVARYYLDTVKDVFAHELHRKDIHTYIFQAGEQHKQLGTVEAIYHDLAKKRIDRKALIVNLGGGVVTDLGGFAAATFLRGIACINISTTLEGMVDASVGGKTGVNLGILKNYVGVFAQPKLVIADSNTLKTLPDRVLLQGYAEVIKHALIADKRFFEESIKISPLKMDDDMLLQAITRSIEIKAQIVQEDETEKAARKLLNFGHTIGHVIESLSMNTDKPLYHGEAVAIGMVAESYISYLTGMIDENEFETIENAVRNVQLPIRYIAKTTVKKVFEKLVTDKKTESGNIKWSLLMGIGVGEFNVAVDDKFVREAIEYILAP